MSRRRHLKQVAIHLAVILALGSVLTIGFAALGAWRSGKRNGEQTVHFIDHGNAVWQIKREYWFGVRQDWWRAEEILYDGLSTAARASQADYYLEKRFGDWKFHPDDRVVYPPPSGRKRSRLRYATRSMPRVLLGPLDDVAHEKLSARTSGGRQLLVGWPAPAFGCWFPSSSREWPDPPDVIVGLPLRPATYIDPVNMTSTTGVQTTRMRTTVVRRAIPYLPIWPGIAINISLLGGSSWLLLAALWWTRRLNRRRRGRCPTCAYDLANDLPTGCPECGWRRSGGRSGLSEVTLPREACPS